MVTVTIDENGSGEEFSLTLSVPVYTGDQALALIRAAGAQADGRDRGWGFFTSPTEKDFPVLVQWRGTAPTYRAAADVAGEWLDMTNQALQPSPDGEEAEDERD